jgi:hypothetical protein
MYGEGRIYGKGEDRTQCTVRTNLESLDLEHQNQFSSRESSFNNKESCIVGVRNNWWKRGCRK